MLNGQNLSRIFQLSALFTFVFLGWMWWGYTQNNHPYANSAVLQGNVHALPAKLLHDTDDKIQPGTPVKLSLTIENHGQLTSIPGHIYIRYAFAKPLEHEPQSILFQTERKPVPSLAPGQKITLHFDKQHELPSLLDFIRFDWSMREYQAVLEMGETEKTIGTLAITFSAYYYPGIKKEFPTPVPAQEAAVQAH